MAKAQRRAKMTIGQIPQGFAFPLAGLSKKGTSASPLVTLFDLMYLLHQKEQVKNITAGDWDAPTGASWKDRLSCCSLHPRDPWVPEKLEYDLQPSCRNECRVQGADISKDPVSLTVCLLFIAAVKGM